jgi:hypothetical protein
MSLIRYFCQRYSEAGERVEKPSFALPAMQYEGLTVRAVFLRSMTTRHSAFTNFTAFTQAFYERGWSGINVEPLDEYFEKLMLARPRDRNLKVVVGREAGRRTLHVIAGTGLSTLDPKIAGQHRANP